ncbi:hypothetical protein LCGC14_0556510 [marine sediment metagenome]|uniref:Uncharacterized protein n=1 Tax=marine sediment metagenome TaxID=412755 RepID=A0A0F9UWI4_9ZZZZ
MKLCKHQWHFVRELSEGKIAYEYHSIIGGFIPLFKGNPNPTKLLFVCDVCGNFKKIKRGREIRGLKKGV